LPAQTTAETELARTLARLDVHDHLCLIYESREEQLAAVIPFIRIGLKRGEQCMYIADDNTASEVLTAMRDAGIDIETTVARGQLTVASKRETYLKQGRFDPDWMIEFLRQAIVAAEAAGYRALRVTGEMTWALGDVPGGDRLIEYEAKLNRLLSEHACLAICQYNRQRFPAAIIRDVIRTHPLVIHGGTVARHPYYVPPDEFLSPTTTAAEVERLLNSIAQHQREHEALRQSEERVRLLLDSTAEAIYGLDLQGNCTFCNRACQRILGYEDSDQLLGKNVHQLIHHTHPNGTPYALEDCRICESFLRGEAVHVEDEVLWRADGTSFPAECWSHPVRRDGRVVGSVVTFLDITEHRQAEAARAESRIALETSADIVRAIPAGLFIYQHDDADRLILLDANPEAQRLTGVKLQQWQGHEFDEIWPDARRRGITEAFTNVARTGQVHETEDLYYRDDRLEGAYHVHVFPMPGDRVGVAFQDVTELTRAQHEREKLLADLAAKNAELERFAYTVSHDLKSPLITIKGFAGLLCEDAANGDLEAVRANVDRVANAAGKMAELLDDLLELSRIGRQVNPPKEVALEDLAREAIELVGGRIAEGRVRVELSNDLPVLYGDRRRLLEVMQNLIDNAAKYMGDQSQPRIEVGVRRDGEEVCFVRDNGVGIKPPYHEKVFGLFDQLDPTVEGTGLGLALVRRIIETHGGRIWVESEGDGRGSTFCFTVPSERTSDDADS